MPTPPIWHPFTQHGLGPVFPRIERAEGAVLFTEDGREIVDAIASWWVTLHGHGHPRIAQAIARQAQRLEQVIFAQFTHGPAEDLAQGLLARAPQGLETVFFSDNGSTAVEVALKMAIGHWARERRGRGRPLFAALEHAYHGDTFGAMAVGERGVFTQEYAPLLFDVARLPFPHPGREQETLKAWEDLLAQQGERVAALIVEPLVLGAGGMLTYPPHVLARLAATARCHGVPWIADEVMTGFGRTGSFFAVDQLKGLEPAGDSAGHTRLSPDLLCLSKGITGGFLPLGATLASGAVFQAFQSPQREHMFFHGHSYTANPIACAAALASLEVFSQEPVMERIQAIGQWHDEKLAALAGHPRVAAVRRVGVIAAVEFQAADGGYLHEMAPALSAFSLSRGVLLRPLGNVVYILPPYGISHEQLNKAHDLIAESLELPAPR